MFSNISYDFDLFAVYFARQIVQKILLTIYFDNINDIKSRNQVGKSQ